MQTKRFEIPTGLSAIFDYSYVKKGIYPIAMKNEKHICNVEIISGDTDKLVYDVHVSDDIAYILNSPITMLNALELSGATAKKLVYYK